MVRVRNYEAMSKFIYVKKTVDSFFPDHFFGPLCRIILFEPFMQ